MSKLNIVIFANTEPKREKGLMFLEKIGSNDCAFFIFENECSPSFWNKNVNFPIDVGYADIDAKLVDIKCLEANQLEPVKSKHNRIKYVIETNKNWFSDNNIKIGISIWEILNITNFINNN